jgi:sirohydrochlorin cobaltochelatase
MSQNQIVLAMHGAPPQDFPRREMGEFFGLHSRLTQSGGPPSADLQKRHNELETKMRAWPRTAENDPFHAASLALAADLQAAAGCPVRVGFNEFCAPSLEEALDAAAAEEPDTVIVVTPMMTRGGEHAEQEIPELVEAARQRHPGVVFRYAWPFPSATVAQFLANQIGCLD